jgi:hypothetical protein
LYWKRLTRQLCSGGHRGSRPDRAGQLLGDRNWWLPRWLGRLIPDIEIEPRVVPAR